MTDLEKLNKLFAIINLTVFCERYKISYDYMRKVLKGDRKLSEEFHQTILKSLIEFQIDFSAELNKVLPEK